MKRLLQEFETLPKNPKATISSWLAMRGDHLIYFAAWYSQAYQEALPKPDGKPAPTHLDRKLSALEHAFRDLAKALENQSSSIRGALSEAEIDMSEWGPVRWKELREMEGAISTMRTSAKPEAFPLTQRLVNVVATIVRRDLGGKKEHVLPIAQSIHRWATKDTNGEFLGGAYIDASWERAKRP